MTMYISLVRKVSEEGGTQSWSWSGFGYADSELHAAANLAVSVEGYTMPESPGEDLMRCIVERFLADGWEFRIIEICTEDNMPVEFKSWSMKDRFNLQP